MKITLILIFIIAINLIAINSYAWTGETHQYICNEAGYPDLDCARADRERTPSPYYHHCENNLPDCRARIKAREFQQQGQLDISAHLWADSQVPVHWVSLDYNSCHGPFEKKVEKAIKSGENEWSINQTCIVDGKEVFYDFDSERMKAVIRYVKNQLYMAQIPMLPIITKQRTSWLDLLIDFINNILWIE